MNFFENVDIVTDLNHIQTNAFCQYELRMYILNFYGLKITNNNHLKSF